MKTHPTLSFQQLEERHQQVADLVRCYRRELASWQEQLVRHSAWLLIERTRRDWALVSGDPR